MTALYGLLMMRLGGKETTPETMTAMKQISRFIAMLAHYYKLNDEDHLFKNDE